MLAQLADELTPFKRILRAESVLLVNQDGADRPGRHVGQEALKRLAFLCPVSWILSLRILLPKVDDQPEPIGTTRDVLALAGCVLLITRNANVCYRTHVVALRFKFTTRSTPR